MVPFRLQAKKIKAIKKNLKMKNVKKYCKLAKRKTLSLKMITALRKGLDDRTRSIRDLAAFVEQEAGISLQQKSCKVFFHKMLQKLLGERRKMKRPKEQEGPKLVVSNDPGLVSERRENLLMFAADGWPHKYSKMQI